MGTPRASSTLRFLSTLAQRLGGEGINLVPSHSPVWQQCDMNVCVCVCARPTARKWCHLDAYPMLSSMSLEKDLNIDAYIWQLMMPMRSVSVNCWLVVVVPVPPRTSIKICCEVRKKSLLLPILDLLF